MYTQPQPTNTDVNLYPRENQKQRSNQSTHIGGLSRSHRIQRNMRANEVQFMLIASSVRLCESKQARAESQRNDRKAKR